MQNSHIRNILVTFFTSAALLVTPPARANLLFEGWFQVLAGSEKVGFFVERYEFNNNKFKCVTYLKTNAGGNNVTESLKAESGPDLSPSSYQYTSKTGDNVKVIDATFKADMMTLNIFDGKKKTVTSKRIKKGTFLSEFLIYVVLNQKNGLKIGNDFKYNAIAEEEGTAYTGSLLVKNQEPVKGKDAFRLINEFKGEKYISWVTPRGEPLLVRQPNQNIDVRFAENEAAATEGITVNKNDLALLFGKVPGESASDNTEASPVKRPTKNVTKPAPTPTGEGIEIKPPPKSSDNQ